MAAHSGSFPVFMRIGDHPEYRIGTLDVDEARRRADGTFVTADLAGLLRAAADELERFAAAGEDQ